MNDRESMHVTVAEGIWGPRYAELAQQFCVSRLDRPATRVDLTATDALVVRNRTQVTRQLLESAPRLRIVARAGAGLDNVDVTAADELGVVVVAAAGTNAVSVAEHTIGLALAVARRTTELDRQVRAGEWPRRAGRELAGGVWGLLSVGATGRATGRLAKALGMTPMAYDPYCDPSDARLAEIGITLHPLEEVVATCDVLSVHLPATAATRGMVDAELLANARPGLILVSVGRGDAIDEEAVVAALRSGRLAGAGLDVRGKEPPDRGALESLPNVVLTPHIAGITEQSQARIADLMCEGVTAVLTGQAAPQTATTRTTPKRRGRL